MKANKQAWASTIKSMDTEECIDILFYRPIGYRVARFFQQLGAMPNRITIAAIFIGVAAGVCFYFSNLWVNMAGILLLIWANIYDSADGQLARLTGQRSALGRILDGMCGDCWFVAIYLALIFRLEPEWGWKIWALGIATGYFHALQAGMADYYRNVHLLFLKGKSGSELDNSNDLKKKYRQLRWCKEPFVKLFEACYLIYTTTQERRTPHLQAMLRRVNETYGETPAESFRSAFRARSLPLMKYTNILSFNTRAIVLSFSLLAGVPWMYFVFGITALNMLLAYMSHRHEKICRTLTDSLPNSPQATPFSGPHNVKGILLDYGGTIDSDGKHWAEALWESYRDNSVPVDKEQFREAYIYAERYLAQHPVIESHDNFLNVLRKKTGLQLKYLIKKGILPDDDQAGRYAIAVSNQCYTFVRSILEEARPVVEALAGRYPVVLVSNFYGNVREVLRDFGLIRYFDDIIESAAVGVRKPDPAIFTLGVRSLGVAPKDVAAIGDSYSKDIVPAAVAGCQTIWLNGAGWENNDTDATAASVIIRHFTDLKTLFQL
jgi:FMN phosphatase YigB (HAD superfamily)